MKLCSLILLLGVCSPHWTTAAVLKRGSYFPQIHNGVLESVTVTGDSIDIDLSGLKIKQIREKAFDDLTNIRSLNLANNELENLPPLIFSKLENLETLSLADNKISTLDRNFVGLNKLRSLNMTNNLIGELLRGSLFGITKSADIIVEGNGLHLLTSNMFMDPSLFDPTIRDIIHEEVERPNYFVDTDEFQVIPIPESFAVRLCMSNSGHVKFIDELKPNQKLDGCMKLVIKRNKGELDMRYFGVRTFAMGWYRLSGDFINSIDLSHNEITEITPELLNDLPPSLYAIKLQHNEIEMIGKDIIENNNLKKLYLGSNFISTIEDGAFKKTQLTAISLPNNHLESLAFARTLPTTIERLDVCNNNIAEIPEDSLINLKKLRYLRVSDNDVINLSPNTFRGLKELKAISFAGNNLQVIEPGMFEDQEKLIHLSLVGNRISELIPGTFTGLTMLEDLNLEENEIRKISEGSFAGLKNPNGCYITLYKNKIDTIEEGSFAGMNIRDLHLAFNKISEESIAKGAFTGSTIDKLYLYNNLFTSINGDSFYGILGFYHLHFAINQIESIKKGDAKYMGQVKSLNLALNKVERLENGALYGIRTESATNIHLYETPLKVIQGGLFDNM